ncbi:MAG: squalene/phytoene synthase family protein [Dehalococcoidia bacterium]|nr:squalene/phytoene synthase family protein [Dehalococcoidia bacterium]
MTSLDYSSDISAGLLKGVSRSFYLTIRVLPRPVRKPIQLAYLLARAADTIADTDAVPSANRLGQLERFRARLSDRSIELPAVLSASPELQVHHDEPETELLQALPRLFVLLDNLPEDDHRNVQKTVDTLVRGMEFDLTTFPAPESGRIGALDTLDDLDRYTYLVAGCVGEFWTDVMIAHERAVRNWDRERMADLGVRFGKALQMTNIIRDVPKDLRAGRCYVPREILESVGLTPEALLSPASSEDARPALTALVRHALDFYVSAEEYIQATPRRCIRIRLAMIWPVLIGLTTLELLVRSASWLDPETRIRVSRPWVYGMMVRSVPCASSNAPFTSWTQRLRTRIEDLM